ncbi:hypothetical protein JCM2811A_40800 [Methylorubrum rhodinum]
MDVAQVEALDLVPVVADDRCIEPSQGLAQESVVPAAFARSGLPGQRHRSGTHPPARPKGWDEIEDVADQQDDRAVLSRPRRSETGSQFAQRRTTATRGIGGSTDIGAGPPPGMPPPSVLIVSILARVRMVAVDT